jgi:hypothetical protein
MSMMVLDALGYIVARLESLEYRISESVRRLYLKERKKSKRIVRPNFVDAWIEGSKLCTLVDRKVCN